MARYKKVTSIDVAKLAGVSQSTVSMVLNRNPKMNFSQETIDKVCSAAEQLGYQNHKSRKLSLDTSKNVMVVCPGL